jgi:hypothetical protein
MPPLYSMPPLSMPPLVNICPECEYLGYLVLSFWLHAPDSITVRAAS